MTKTKRIQRWMLLLFLGSWLQVNQPLVSPLDFGWPLMFRDILDLESKTEGSFSLLGHGETQIFCHVMIWNHPTDMQPSVNIIFQVPGNHILKTTFFKRVGFFLFGNSPTPGFVYFGFQAFSEKSTDFFQILCVGISTESRIFFAKPPETASQLNTFSIPSKMVNFMDTAWRKTSADTWHWYWRVSALFGGHPP